jgi:valine dehydrogenase (NAD+)
VSGVGKVGRHLVRHLLDDGASVVVADVNPVAVEAVRATYPQVEAVGVDTIAAVEADVYSPCALGGALSDETVPALRAEIVCGAANNQLAHEGVDKLLVERGILYAPDFCVNSGGVIQVADEIEGFSFERAKARAAHIYDTTLTILRSADAEHVSPAVAADRHAERRMSDIGRLRAIHLPRQT